MKRFAIVLVLLLFGCTGNTDSKIDLVDIGNGESAYLITLPITPYGDGHFLASDGSVESENLLLELRDDWQELWPTMLSSMQKAAKDYKVDFKIDSDEFFANVDPVDPDAYMGDQADFAIAIQPYENAVPEWHFFIRDAKIVHFQPVF